MSFLKKLFKAEETQKSGIIFIVEDNAAYAQTLQVFLRSAFPEMKEVKIFPVGETCLMELHRNPDMIIIDYFLDSKYYDAETGLEIVKQIRVQKPEMNIIVLSSQNDIDVVIEAVKQHDCSYVRKDEEAFERVEEIIREI
ncbi:MAG TPA: response regulator [Bacteroidia bacterium]|nr:response regulator [Bacteroidia bacterium]